MRTPATRLIPFLLAFVLGVGAAALTACGGSESKALIPAANAGQLKDDLRKVQDAIDSARCNVISAALNQADTDIQQLPNPVSQRLVDRLKEGVLRLRTQAPRACSKNVTTTATVPSVTTVQPVTTATTPPTTSTATTPTTTTPPTTPSTPTTPTPTTTSDTGGVTTP